MDFRSHVVGLLAVLVVLPLARADFQLKCPMLPVEACAFAVDCTGHRCVLEKQLGTDLFVCQTSDIKVGEDAPVDYIETDNCVTACGVDRMTIGFSTDELSSGTFVSKMCSPACRSECLNLVDLYSKIIADLSEVVSISEFCGEQRRATLIESRRLTAGAAAPT